MARLKTMAPRLGSATPKLRPAPKRVEPFYRSAPWLALVASRKLDADYFAAKARAKADGSQRVILDHVHERKDGGADLDPSNTAWLTFNEHQAKTARARARRAQGIT